MYDKLLISAGGGIISIDQQAEQDSCATIAIGLGGTGISCLRALKKEIYTRVKPDDKNNLIASYKHIKFLAVDTDRGSLGDTGAIDTLDGATEFMDISCPNIQALLKDAYLLQQEESLRWLKAAGTQNDGSGISILSAQAGAGGVRQVGRLLLLRSCTAFVNKVRDIINEARRDLPGTASINIHIFTGLSGGTGAGTFLDVCYLVQHVLDEIGLGGQAYTCGYFFMPDVNLSQTPGLSYVPVNGFASLKELDYCMNFEHNGGEWDQQYPNFRIKTGEPPVKLAHLITATAANGAIVTNAYEYAMRAAVDYVLEYIIKPFVADGDDENSGTFSIHSHISNVNRLIEGVPKKHGATYNYCVLGAANAYLPYKEINTYLVAKIFEGFAGLSKRVPFSNDIDAMVQNWGMRYEDILRLLRDKVPDVPLYEVDHKELFNQVQGLTTDSIPQLCSRMTDSMAKINGKLEENKAALIDDKGAPVVGSGQQIFSLISRVKKEVTTMASAPDKGPYYAAAFLHNLNSVDLLNKLQGYLKQNATNLSQARANMQLREQSLAQALTTLQSSCKRKYAEGYMQAVRAWYSELAKISLFTTMDTVLTELSGQINKLYAGFFGILTDVMGELQATFNANLTTLATPVAEDHRYAVKLMSLQDEKLKDALDQAVGKMDINGQIRIFVDAMVANPEKWITRESDKICKFVSAHFLDQLNTFSNMTIIDYLKEKFETEDTSTLKQKIYSEIMLPLGDKSAPLFWLDAGKHDLADSPIMGYLSIPSISDEILAAAQQFSTNNPEIDIRKSYSTDRITIFKFVCGIPMFAYKGIENYCPRYQESVIVGKHLYEGAVGDPRDWRGLIDISPVSCRQTYTPEEKDAMDQYDKALACGLISKEAKGAQTEYRLNSFDTDEIEKCVAFGTGLLQSGEVEKMNAFLQNRQSQQFAVVSSRLIMSGKEGELSDRMAKDFVTASPVYLALLKEQMAQLSRYTDLLDAMKGKTAGELQARKDIHEFAMALMTGAVKKLNNYEFAYCYETYGIEESVSLTSIDAVPYGMTLPLYSAYCGFIALEDGNKQSIGALVKKNMVEKPELVKQCLEDTKLMVVPEKVNAMVAQARQTFPDKATEIISWIKGFTAEVTTFAMQF